MKKTQIFSSKITIAITFALLGICSTVFAQHIIKNKKSQSDEFSKIIEEHQKLFADNDNFFTEINAMEKNMNEIFENHRKQMRKAFEEANKNSKNTNKSSISAKEDADNYYYELNFFGFKKEDIVIAVKDNVLTFTAESKKETNDKNHASSTSANFYYSFYVPQYDSSTTPEIVRQDNAIKVKLTKKIHSEVVSQNKSAKN